jgi:MoaA/NifB/PqqE/SkfB family radical SAM enzyme
MKSLNNILSMASRGTRNFITKRPFCVSFEITYACNARCRHCHLGGPHPDEHRATAQEFAARARELGTLVAQVSGGEPLLRRDVEDIVGALKRQGRVPYVVLTTNGALLDRAKHLALRAAGVDSFSLSLDYPDERHDSFRGIPGLFSKIVDLLKSLQDVKDKAIVLSAVVQRDNYRDLMPLVEFARRWGVHMNFSTYTWLRTEIKDFMIPPDELPELRHELEKVRADKQIHPTVFTSDFVFEKMPEFFRQHSISGCRAGERFLVVNPDATLSPCGLIIRDYKTRKDLTTNFCRTNTCGDCYTSIRANNEKPIAYLIRDSLRAIR